MIKLVRITTVPVSMQVLLKGQLRHMKSRGFDVHMISADGPEREPLMAQEDCPHTVVSFTRTISPWQDLKCLIQLTRQLRKLKPQIVHTHTPKAGLLGMWAAKLAGVPVRLHTIAGLPWMEYSGPMRTLLKLMEKLTAMPAQRVYPNSKRMEDFLKKEGVAIHKMKVLGHGSSNGINSGHFSKHDDIEADAKRLLSLETVPADGWVWIFIGRIVTDKGMGELLRAFASVHQRYPSDRLWLLGQEEPELDPLDADTNQILKTHPAIKAWGFQKDVRPFLAASKVLVFPSYREGFPNVPIQAGSMGCALILSDINGCNEIVTHAEDGLLVPVKNTEALLKAMLDMRSTPGLQTQYANSIREHIRLHFDQQSLWLKIEDEYRYWLHEKKIAHELS